VQRLYAVEDDRPDWLDLRVDDTPSGSTLIPRDKTVHPWPAGADSTVTLDGVAQRFEGGLMLFLGHTDGSRSIIVVTSRHWREWPD
jgi:hypothetical protein